MQAYLDGPDRMTRHHPRWSRRIALGQAMIPAVLIALVLLVGALTWHARRSEESHRAMAERAVRDYAAFAAWQFTRDLTEHAHMVAHNAMHELDTLFRGPAARADIPSPEVLRRSGDSPMCNLALGSRFVFRIDYPSGLMTVVGDTAGRATPELRHALAERLRGLAARPAVHGSGVRLLVDTIAGERRAVAWGAVERADGSLRAAYGVDGDPARIAHEVKHSAGLRPILPPSLLNGRRMEDVLTLRVSTADGGELYTLGGADSSGLSATDATPLDHGGLITMVSIPPRSADVLLIGGMPRSRLPMLVMVLVLTMVLVGIALVQLRRGRELARLRTRFVASVSHELRTPLAQISMFSETLLLGRERSSDERQHFLSVIYREARRLSQLVESVLTFSRAEAGPRTFRPESRDVSEEVHDAVRAFSPLAASTSVELGMDLIPDAWAMVEPGALRQVMINLLDNAVKFGPEGQCVRVRVARDDDEIVVSVEDEGPGIPPAQRKRVFEPFAQSENPGTRNTTGAGIGLAVVAELVAAHGGRVWIEDAERDHGVRVVFTIPAVPADERGEVARTGVVARPAPDPSMLASAGRAR